VEGLFVAEHDPGGAVATVVLVHGSLDRSAAFARVQRHLDDLRVLRYDRRGYGRSLATGPATSLEEQVDDLEQVVGNRPAVLVGHSLGGVLALALAARRPALALAVVAYEAPMPWAGWGPGSTAGSVATAGTMPDQTPAPDEAAAAAERFMRRMIGDERWERLPERTRTQRRAEGPALLADLHAVRHRESPYDPAALSMPVVAAHGTESAPHHQASAVRLSELAPRGELAVVDGAGHGVHLTHPAALAELARRAVALASGQRPPESGHRAGR
jgi:pimeloyl-ACP methyl ester carboxylesterase